MDENHAYLRHRINENIILTLPNLQKCKRKENPV